MAGADGGNGGEGRWRLQEAERNVNAVRSELNQLSKDFLVHRVQTEEFIARSQERWRDDDQRREQREKEFDEWREAQEKRTAFVNRVATAALIAFLTTALAGIVNAIILVAAS